MDLTFKNLSHIIRLSEYEFQTIIKHFGSLLNQIPFELYLFGSRTDITKKGGDIDLMIILFTEYDYLWFLDQKIFLISHIKGLLDDQKIDLLVTTPDKIKNDPFIATLNQKILLSKNTRS